MNSTLAFLFAFVVFVVYVYIVRKELKSWVTSYFDEVQKKTEVSITDLLGLLCLVIVFIFFDVIMLLALPFIFPSACELLEAEVSISSLTYTKTFCDVFGKGMFGIYFFFVGIFLILYTIYMVFSVIKPLVERFFGEK